MDIVESLHQLVNVVVTSLVIDVHIVKVFFLGTVQMVVVQGHGKGVMFVLETGMDVLAQCKPHMVTPLQHIICCILTPT